jgi:hypothetical protein
MEGTNDNLEDNHLGIKPKPSLSTTTAGRYDLLSRSSSKLDGSMLQAETVVGRRDTTVSNDAVYEVSFPTRAFPFPVLYAFFK